MTAPNDTAETIALEIFDTPEGRSDPYPRYHRLRSVEPVHHNQTLGMWFLSRYEDCAAMLRDPRFGKDYAKQVEGMFGADWRKHPALTSGERSMLNLEGPDHTRLRRMVVKEFNRRTVDSLLPRIETIVDRLLDPFAEAGGGDLLDALAFPMPVTVIGELLGVPEEDRPPFRDRVRDLTAIFELKPTDEQIAAADAAQVEIQRYFDDLIAAKRKQPDEALLSRLVHLDADGDRLANDELNTLAWLLFAAGFETTTNLIGNGMLALIDHPDQMQILRDEPERLPLLPDELLRYDGTAQMAARFTHDEVEIGGVKIPRGELVFALLGAANHDPDEFDGPDRIDVARPRFRPMSFGGGTHFCLGASLARSEIEIVMRSMLDRFESIELAGSRPRFRDRLTLRGLENLELRVRQTDRSPARRTPAPARTAPEPIHTRKARSDDGAGATHVRPTPGSEADRRWRNDLRTRLESDAGAGDTWLPSNLDVAQTMVLLARAELFRSCDAKEIAELAATAYPISFEEGDRLCEEGAESLECYVIEEGDADVTIDGERVRTIGEGDVVGERGLLEDAPRSATVTATSHMITYAISRQRLLALVEESPTAREGMFASMRRRYRD